MTICCEPCFKRMGARHEAIVCIERRYLCGECARSASPRIDWLGVAAVVGVFIAALGVLLK